MAVHWLSGLLLLALAPGCAATLARVDSSMFPDPPRNAITFWGHACCYIDVGGFGIVTDPMFENSATFRRRKVPAPPRSAYAGARVILISHAHDDHLSPATIATFPESTLVLCPEPSARYLSEPGRVVRTMKPGDEFEYPGGRIVAVAAHHPGGRFSNDAEADGRALGYVIYAPEARLYYSGDTDPFPGFEAVARAHQPTLVILNVNGHLKSMDAVRAAQSLGAQTVVPVHYGVFGYLFWGERKAPRSYEELSRHLGPILVPLELGRSLPLGGQAATPLPESSR